MYGASAEARFSATHYLTYADGRVEHPHEHNWLVRAHCAARELDRNGMVIDFDVLKSSLECIISEFHLQSLNEHEGFAGKNPTAEAVARHVFRRLRDGGLTEVVRVEVTEAPGCMAAYEGDTRCAV